MDTCITTEGVEPSALGEDKEVLSSESEANTIDPELLSEALREVVAHRDALQCKGSRRDEPAVGGHRREVLWVSIKTRDISDLPRLAPSSIEVRVHGCPRREVARHHILIETIVGLTTDLIGKDEVEANILVAEVRREATIDIGDR